MNEVQTKKEVSSGKEEITLIDKGIEKVDIHKTICCVGPFTFIW